MKKIVLIIIFACSHNFLMGMDAPVLEHQNQIPEQNVAISNGDKTSIINKHIGRRTKDIFWGNLVQRPGTNIYNADLERHRRWYMPRFQNQGPWAAYNRENSSSNWFSYGKINLSQKATAIRLSARCMVESAVVKNFNDNVSTHIVNLRSCQTTIDDFNGDDTLLNHFAIEDNVIREEDIKDILTLFHHYYQRLGFIFNNDFSYDISIPYVDNTDLESTKDIDLIKYYYAMQLHRNYNVEDLALIPVESRENSLIRIKALQKEIFKGLIIACAIDDYDILGTRINNLAPSSYEFYRQLKKDFNKLYTGTIETYIFTKLKVKRTLVGRGYSLVNGKISNTIYNNKKLIIGSITGLLAVLYLSKKAREGIRSFLEIESS